MNDRDNFASRLKFLHIDDQSRKSSAHFFSQIQNELAPALEGLFNKLATVEETRAIMEENAERQKLERAQAAHFERLLNGQLDEEYTKSTKQIGIVHDVIGLEPRWYIGGYFLVIEHMLSAFLKKSGVKSPKITEQISAMLRSCALDMDLTLESYVQNMEKRKMRDQLLTMSEEILKETDLTIQSVSDQASLMQENVLKLNTAQIDLEKQVDIAAESLTSTVQAIHTVATATEQLDTSSQSITRQVQTSQNLVQDAIAQSQRSQETVSSLENSAQEISSVVALVQNIASQTRLLALNATIEAARAGEAGKGFAVVASEVKNLAAETEKAIDQVNAQSAEIQQATERAAREIETTNQLIQQMGNNVGNISEAVDQQHAATSEISNSASSASDSTTSVNTSMADVGTSNTSAQSIARKVANITNNVTRDVKGLSQAMILLMRLSDAGNRRKSERVPLGMEVTLTQNGTTYHGTTADLSLGGSSLRIADANEKISLGRCEVEFAHIGRFEMHIVNIEDPIVSTAFGYHSETEREEITDLLERTKAEDKIYIDFCQEAAQRVEASFEDALTKNKLAFEDFFDIDYQPIANTNPRQLLTQFTSVCDEYLPDIQEEIVERDEKIAFMAAVDRAGYLPTHNKVYMKEQSDDPVWNDANCRNRRIFADPSGLRAARNTQTYLLQAYDRKVGDQTVLLKEVDAPIYIRGRHWGNMRMAYKL